MLRPGTFLGNRYEIKSRIGAGGMSDVYKAMDLKLNRLVAIKVLKDEFSSEPNFVSKFRKEAQNAAGLSHPNIVGVYDVGEDRGVHYIVMELIEGITLKKYIERKKKLEIRESIEVAMQVARGIEAAHAQGIIHRDIKPQNIMISREGKVKVTDFGIARAASGQTISSNTMGSVHYISPEQARGGYCDERSDIYSLGITLYEMLTGRVPFEGDSTVAVALLHIQGDMVPPRQYEPLIPVSLEKIILKCTQKKQELRYSNATELIADLRKSLTAPNEDFVRISSLKSDSPTVVFTGDDKEQIESRRQQAREREEKEARRDREEPGKRNVRRSYEDEPEEDPYDGGGRVEKVITVIIVVVALAIVVGVAALVISGIHNTPAEQTTEEITAAPQTAETEEAVVRETVQKVEMRNLLGLPKDQAIRTLDSQGLKYILEEGPSDVYEDGLVFEQEYKAGDMVDVNTVVILKVSTGVGEVQVPDTVIGLEEAEARTALRRLGFNVPSTSRTEGSSGMTAGRVSGTDPAVGTMLKKGASVTLIVSTGPTQAETTTAAPTTTAPTEAPTTASGVSVPDLSSYTLEEARSLLEELGLTVGSVTEAFSRDEQAGQVVSQSDLGQTVARGTAVDLVIGRGAELDLLEEDEPIQVFEDGGDPDYEVPEGEVIVVPGNAGNGE